ncbi:probable receptor-like serine/threonine-protein kinase At5g57670 isoform X1 [Olea europaea var. sylvestris]|uniref:probable receptor-like serine/threonine-protein kinase At5g57670 isoform X1 n=1 Tax=Olea europaea var. sylvestris TaxID=158386 RepID=UPI000C1CCEDE|nr:probable receptor-like serine/threonine-protein kinase At5g57670 isoform X1 [Olea europaea var. sylvestris]
MTVERLGKIVVVGIQFDGHTKELMDWAVMKVADPGDCVIAIHVCRSSDSVPRENALLDDYLEDYKGMCNQRQVALSSEVLKGNSIRKVLVREAKNHSASVVIVGITKFSSFGGWSSIAKYCSRRLPSTTEVMAIHNEKVVFRRSSKNQPEGPQKDPKPSFYLTGIPTFKDTQSEFGVSEISEMGRLSYDGILTSKDEVFSPVGRHKKGSLSSISLPAEDFTQQRPGWPLLQTSSSITQPSLEARKMSVVRWVMSLPSRSSLEVSELKSILGNTGDVLGGEYRNCTPYGTVDKISSLKGLPQELELILETNPHTCKWFIYDVLRMSASQFSTANLIGQGGCNSVYKGLLPDGKRVAIKILRSTKEAWKDFILEVDIMTTLKHKRIAHLLGICVEHTNLISVYDFLSKGNLEENLHCNRKEKSVLQWEVRFKVAVGIAEALNYLHNECPRPVIHRDVKSSNILLTDDLEPQLCDFGLAIWGPTSASFLSDRDVVGTFGYLAPEYFMYGKVSDKIDVYAFGVVLLELLSGRKPIGLETPKGQESLVMWAKTRLETGDLKSILDPNLEVDINVDQMQRMALAATLCLKQAARLRPKISQVRSSLFQIRPLCLVIICTKPETILLKAEQL